MGAETPQKAREIGQSLLEGQILRWFYSPERERSTSSFTFVDSRDHHFSLKASGPDFLYKIARSSTKTPEVSEDLYVMKIIAILEDDFVF